MRLASLFAALTLAYAGSAMGQSYQVNYEQNVNRPGGDYRNFELKSADPALCGGACLMESQCRAFTYVRPGLQGAAAHCWLKNSVPGPTAHPCCTSGVRMEVRAPTPQDTPSPSDLDDPA
jgi:hypothetical protein